MMKLGSCGDRRHGARAIAAEISGFDGMQVVVIGTQRPI